MTKSLNRTAAERAEISRRNGATSRGPKTPEGKERSKFNGLKHGMEAETLILPGEDAQAYQSRLDAWTADRRPRNELERSLIEKAVRASWLLDRINRLETARLSDIILTAIDDEAQRRDDEVAELGGRLLNDLPGPFAFDSRGESRPDPPRIVMSGSSDEHDDPATIVHSLGSTGAGCRWLLDQWAALHGVLDQGLAWQEADQLRALRLLGRRPLDRETLPPGDQPDARRVLIEIVDRATSELAAMAELHEEREAAETAELAARQSFDPSDEGERYWRFEMSCNRSLLSAIEGLIKLRSPRRKRNSGTEPTGLANAAQTRNSGTEPAGLANEGRDRNLGTEPTDVADEGQTQNLGTEPTGVVDEDQTPYLGTEPTGVVSECDTGNSGTEPTGVDHSPVVPFQTMTSPKRDDRSEWLGVEPSQSSCGLRIRGLFERLRCARSA